MIYERNANTATQENLWKTYSFLDFWKRPMTTEEFMAWFTPSEESIVKKFVEETLLGEPTMRQVVENSLNYQPMFSTKLFAHFIEVENQIDEIQQHMANVQAVMRRLKEAGKAHVKKQERLTND